MSSLSRDAEAQNPESISSVELAAIVGWLRTLPREDLRKLLEALASHDAQDLTGYVAKFRNCLKSSS
jgi:hypothetical protein